MAPVQGNRIRIADGEALLVAGGLGEHASEPGSRRRLPHGAWPHARLSRRPPDPDTRFCPGHGKQPIGADVFRARLPGGKPPLFFPLSRRPGLGHRPQPADLFCSLSCSPDSRKRWRWATSRCALAKLAGEENVSVTVLPFPCVSTGGRDHGRPRRPGGSDNSDFHSSHLFS